MNKIKLPIFLLLMLLITMGCSQETKYIQLGFESRDVQFIEVFIYTNPNEAYKYVVTDVEKINHIVTVLTTIKCTENKDRDIPAGSGVTSMRFHLENSQFDVTHVELGIKKGIIYSPNRFDYRTQADIRGTGIEGLQGEQVSQDELPNYGN